jgi:hypothetical protein
LAKHSVATVYDLIQVFIEGTYVGYVVILLEDGLDVLDEIGFLYDAVFDKKTG